MRLLLGLVWRSADEEYFAFHSQYFAGFYWSFERILQDMSKWKGLVMKNNSKIVGASFTSLWAKAMGEHPHHRHLPGGVC